MSNPTEDIERRLRAMEKAVRLDVAARLMAAHIARTRIEDDDALIADSIELADKLILENEAMP